MQYRFSYYGKREMQDRLMKYYISKDYTFFLNHNSAELMRDINNDPEMFYAEAVSYTHLDVYKRQQLSRAMSKSIFIASS